MVDIKKLAELLGVEIGEPFEIVRDGKPTNEGVCMLTNDGLYCEEHPYNFHQSAVTMYRLLIGNSEVKKAPWEPAEGEMILFVNNDGQVGKVTYTQGNVFAVTLRKIGNCYKQGNPPNEQAKQNWASWYKSKNKVEVMEW